jgi:ADP-dependent NAD(P)H-hydrate dehydratase
VAESKPIPVTDVPPRPTRATDAHKHTTGRVGILGGGPGMSGAAVLCGLGALRAGAGLVRVFCAAASQPIVATSEPCLMTTALPDGDPTDFLEPLIDGPDWWTVLAVGPGLGRSENALAAVRHVCASKAVPIVLDADGLAPLFESGPNAFVAHGPAAGFDVITWPAVITPHAGEMRRLREGAGLSPQDEQDDDTRVRAAHEYACLIDGVVVYKGPRTVVADPTRAYVNTTGNPGMATGGMGDVLTGLIASLIGQGMEPFDASRLAVYVHGLAADRLAKNVGAIGYLAREVADALPAALTEASAPRIGFR